METYTEISNLLLKHLRQELKPAESTRLTTWVEQSDKNRQFFADINNTPALLADVRAHREGQHIDLEAAWERIKAYGWETEPVAQPKKSFRLQWWYYLAAAVLLIALCIPIYLNRFRSTPAAEPSIVHTPKDDVRPNSSHAYLTLDNGEIIALDSSQGLLARQGNMKVEEKAGALSYSTDGQAATDTLLYNKITVPKGSDVIYLQLSDQSKVWLNAGSSIRYPVVFKDDERELEITGEAYFEVAKLQGKRFVVSKGNMSVTVLGTRFNVNTYENEDDIKVTLLEGSVKVQHEQLVKIIKPGQQAVVDGSIINVVNDVDLQQVMAWKDGKFVFNNTNIQQIMHQMERWYDLSPTQFDNEAVKKWEFNGEISRYSNASKVLQLLEKTGAVKFTVEGKKITVKQL